MKLSYFTEEAYDKLYNSINDNESFYREAEPWIDEYFGDIEYKSKSSVDVGIFKPYYIPGKKSNEQKSQEDLINVRNLYNAMKKLNPIQASNKYMWTYLCHAIEDNHKYIVDRWLQEEQSNTIKTRFFVTSDSGSLFSNGLARLWWYGYLTYDENRSNPYELTEILLMNQTICKDFIDTKNRESRVRSQGVLSALKDFRDTVDPGESIIDYFRDCNKYLNHYAAVTSLDFLSAEEIKDLALVALNNARARLHNK